MKRLIFNTAMLLFAINVMADDSIDIRQSAYDQRMQRKQNAWLSLIPTHFVVQNAGNMGVLSAGIGWSYGKRRQWETDLLFGYIPKHDSSRGKFTTTVKGNYIPWDIDLSSISARVPKQRWYFEPLTTSLYLNTVYGSEFWKSQPGRYPDKYYEFMSTKFRLNLAIGQRITFKIPENKRKRHSRMSLFYEVGTCDLYIRSMFQSSEVKLKDILGLSIGLKFFTL
ncbi:MAG: hypothetical protein J5486_08095 [Bacteroidaceae bacterium]|nr:hypothetical protein [Bacteroidaceae bacterium]